MERQMAYVAANPALRISQTDELWIRRGVRVNPMKKHRKSGGDLFARSLELCVISPSAVLVARSLFDEVGGFDEEHLPMAFQDVDLCLKMHEKGYRIIYTPHAKLYHHESATKTTIAYEREVDYMKNRWSTYIENDPYYNPNLTRFSEGYSLPV
jgi:GT2 family glycosyltransferase